MNKSLLLLAFIWNGLLFSGLDEKLAKLNITYSRPCHNVELQKTFQELKQKQNISSEVSLGRYHWLSPFALLRVASYFGKNKKVLLSPHFTITPQSRKIFVLRHELAHAEQMSRLDWNYVNNLRYQYLSARPDNTLVLQQFQQVVQKAMEYDADKQACEQTSCSTCLTMAKRSASLIPFFTDFFYEFTDRIFRPKKGYFSEEDFDPFIAKSLQRKKYCKAHDSANFRQVTEKLHNKPIWPVKVAYHKYLSCMDRISGTLTDRLKTKEEDVLNLPLLSV